jgi:hypothetical protein
MAVALLLAFQAAATPVPAAPVAINFDLAKLRPIDLDPTPSRCRTGDSSEIVVCGRRGGGDYPYEEMERLFAVKPLIAEMDIGGGAKARAYAEGAEIAPGLVSKRVMFGINTGF